MAHGTTDFSSQRPAIDIRPPSVARHVAYRFDRPSDADTMDRAAAWANQHLDEIQKAVWPDQSVAAAFSERESDRSSRAGVPAFDVSRSSVNVLKFQAKPGFRLRVRFDIYNEFLAVTYILDMIEGPEAGFIDGLLAAVTCLTARPPKSAVLAKEQMAQLDFLYDGFWTAAPGSGAAEDIFRGRVEEEPSADWPRILDFRGVYLDCDPNGCVSDPSGLHRPLSRNSMWHVLCARFADHRRDLIDHAIGRSSTRKNRENGGEPVFCTMLDGDALYLAELGRRNGEGGVEPLRHMLVFADPPSSQVGRLVRRLHMMGELRHAALFDYDNGDASDLRGVSRELRHIGPKIDKVFRSSDPAVTGAPLTNGKNGGDPLAEISKVINLVTALRVNEHGDGVTYRVQQSRYYAEQFRKGLRHLRTGRIPGYQSYDDFVSRFIFQAFARIDGIGNRYEAALRRLNLAATYRTAVEINQYQKHMSTAVEALKESGIRNGELLGAVHRTSKRQNELLKTAEKIAVAVLAYYAGSAAHTVLKDVSGCFEPILARAGRTTADAHLFLDLVWLVAVASLAVYAVWAIWVARKRRRAQADD